MEIKVFGPGCAKCRATYAAIGKVVNECGLDVTLTKVEDIMELLDCGIMTTPAVMVDGVVRIKGYVPSQSEIRKLLGV
ncbi:MAG: thioredoxin family protein [Alistipes sp.]|nr:thioredoxin family protein [Alistipes sp.]